MRGPGADLRGSHRLRGLKKGSRPLRPTCLSSEKRTPDADSELNSLLDIDSVEFDFI